MSRVAELMYDGEAAAAAFRADVEARVEADELVAVDSFPVRKS